MRILVNNVFCSLEATPEVRKALNAKFSTLAPGHRYLHSYKLWKRTKGKKGWDGRVRVLDPQYRFPTGMLPQILAYLQGQGYDLEVEDRRPLPSVTSLESTTVKLRGYQDEALQACCLNEYLGMWWPRGILAAAVGSGKTETAVALYETLNKPRTLFLVHRKDLLHQTRERFATYGIECGQVGDGEYQPGLITVATIQSILQALGHEHKRHLATSLLHQTEMAIFDEAHMVAAKLDGGNAFVRVARQMPNAFFRYGLSGTALMRDRYSDWLLLGTTGEILYRIKSKRLVDMGYLVPPRVIFEHIREPEACAQRWPACRDDGIVFNVFRNRRIAESARSQPKPVIVMTQLIPHAQILHEMLPEFAYLDGSSPSEKRRRVLRGLQDGTIPGLVCTTIFDEGIDLPEIRAVELAGGGRSAIKQIQRMGRGLRKAAGKSEVIIKDYFDHQSRILRRHSRWRMSTLEDEGFTVEEVEG